MQSLARTHQQVLSLRRKAKQHDLLAQNHTELARSQREKADKIEKEISDGRYI